ncbi:uncharacterized protein C8R40DRAFT_397033 [Lentinula edodes]|uniref:uncharacterized protein n=1 Tax=Lentinula edodes TaxID=5353 RepID=UPI001E8D396E|nr:uncharacterized protein C8R40DRAFT_397033 [Lentinula edodes]KAH7873189.1 hypothetical protein C8R40DRAFT_397033 [Lentinula edodes]
MSAPSSPLLDGNSQNNNFSDAFGRDDMVDGSTAFTLLDTLETFLGSHVDLLQRRLQRHSDRLKSKADEVLRRRNSSSPGENVIANLEREAKAFQLKVSSRMMQLASSWQSAKVVRTREKISFFFGVMSLLSSALLFGLAPQWVHIAYTVQALYLLPLRVYFYKKRSWHYFLFDLCYYVNILNFIYIWLLPQSPALFIACYCLSHGSLASAVITWRNSLVFHDQDKVTSLFIHIYAPFSFTVIRHYYPNAEDRFPALNQLRHLNPLRALLLSGGIYLIWQLLYWKFVFVDRRKKIESGQRTSSMSWLLNSKSSIIGKALSKIPPQGRIPSFMFGQLVYSIITELPAVFILYKSPFWSGAFLIAIFSVSVWNGGGFYIEVFGRKFERELEALRKELAEIAQVKPGLNGPSSKLDSFPDEDTMSSRSSSQDFRFPPQPVPSNMTLEGEMPKATET